MEKQILLDFYKKYRPLIISLSIGVSSLVLIIVVILPQLNSLMNDQKKYNDINNKSQILEVKAKELSTLNEGDLKNKVSVALSSLPTDKDLYSIIGVIQNVINGRGFNLVGLQIGQTLGASSKAQGFSVKVEVVGPKESLGQLLSDIEASPRVMKVSSFDVASQSNSKLTDTNIDISVFYASIPNNLGSIDAQLPKLSDKQEELISNLIKLTPVATTFTPVSGSSRGKSNPFE